VPLFEVGRYHVARIDFDADGQIKTMSVRPKYAYRESFPEWNREEYEDLGSAEFDRLMATFEAIRPRGAVVNTDKPSFTVFSAAHVNHDHEFAVVRYGETANDPKAKPAQGRSRRLVGYLEVSFLNSAPRSDRPAEEVLRIAEKIIGPRVAPHPFFTVNEFYALRLRFDRRGNLVDAEVMPKYMFGDTHAEWPQDGFAGQEKLEVLTAQQHVQLLTQLTALQSLGVKRGNTRTNPGGVSEQEYANGRVTWVEGWPLRQAPPGAVRWFSVRWTQ
jgi:hypothetical protein